MKVLLSVALVVILTISASGEKWIPADYKLPERSLLKRDQVTVKTPSGISFKPFDLTKKISLRGTWKFSGLESSETPFPADAGAEIKFAAPDFDDSKWSDIQVPLNWYKNPSTTCDKVLRYGRKVDVNLGADVRRISNPFFKGWYRHSISLPDPLPDGRVMLDFDGIGYEGELFINGKSAGRHHGDFVPFSADITPYIKPGKNLIALRVLSDFGPTDRVFTRTYGAQWGTFCKKAGIWLPVNLVFDTEPRIEKLLLTTDPATGTVQMDYTIINYKDKPLTVIPGAALNFAEAGTPAATAIEFPPVTLKKGVNSGRVKIQEKNPRLWSPDSPNLYFATFYLRENRKIVSSRLERFGFRDFKVNGTGFTLNGKPIYLFLESAHSSQFGGNPTIDGHGRKRPPRKVLGDFRKKGYNILRTSHMPVPEDVLDVADELGMMIYDEWSFCGLANIDEKAFEANNLPELKKFIIRDYNHPCVVMWSLGNEVTHSRDPAFVRQLEKQTALVRKLDLQKRPIAAFAGVGNVIHYGKAKLDTDIMDYHQYVGVTKPWTQWNTDFQNLMYNKSAKIFGRNGKHYKPIVISECIGGGWGVQPNPKYKHGNIDEYIKIIKKPYTFGNPGAAGYSGVVGVKSVLDPKKCWRHTQRYIGSRIVDQIRQDHRISGFGPWIAFATPVSTQWTQPVYPGLRDNSKNCLMPRQLLTPGTLKLEAFVSNQSGDDLKNARFLVELKNKNSIQKLKELTFDKIPAGQFAVKPFVLDLPANKAGAGEIRLTIFNGNKDIGRNYYDITLHRLTDAAKPITGASPMALLTPDAGTEKILADLKIPYSVIDGKTKLADFKCAIIPPHAVPGKINSSELRDWVEGGGRLLILNQGAGTLPAFPEYQISANYNCFVELVITKHPVFKGLTQADFDIWAENPYGNLVTEIILPLNPTALAVKGGFLDSNKCGAAIAEATVGQGRVLVSQVDTAKLWKRNGAATQYLRNLMDYFTTQKAYPARQLERSSLFDFSIVKDRVMMLDISKQANRDFSDKKAGDGIGGWTDQGDNDFHQMPLGKQKAAGIPFYIIDPAKNSGRACIALRSIRTPKYPAEAKGIPVNAKVACLYFLHTLGFGSSKGLAGIYRINYVDGSHYDYKLKAGINIGDWWNPGRLAEAIPGIICDNDFGAQIGLYVSRWLNPKPELMVKSIDCIAAPQNPSIPLLVAITAERAQASPLFLISSNNKTPIGSASMKMVETGVKNIGPWCAEVNLPESKGKIIPNAMFFLFYDKEKLKSKKYHYLSFDLYSNSTGLIDIVLPQAEWHSSMLFSLELGISKGKWTKVRISLDKDFTFTKGKFPLSNLRPEFWIYNGENKAAGYPRRAVSFKITNIRFE